MILFTFVWRRITYIYNIQLIYYNEFLHEDILYL